MWIIAKLVNSVIYILPQFFKIIRFMVFPWQNSPVTSHLPQSENPNFQNCLPGPIQSVPHSFLSNFISYNSSPSHSLLTYWPCSEKVKSLSHVRFSVTPWTVAHQTPQPMGFSRQEYWSRLPFPSPGDLSDPGIEPKSPTLQADALPSEPAGKPWSSNTPSRISQGLCTFFYLREPQN